MSRQDSFTRITGSLVLASALLAGCSSSGYYYDRKTDYIDETTHAPLELPDTADKARFRELMPLPPVALERPLNKDFTTPAPVPMPVTVEDIPPAELIQYAGNDTIAARMWLALADSPAAAWPLLQQEFQKLGWKVLKADPATGRVQFISANSLSGQVVNAILRQGVRTNFSDLELLDNRGQVRTDNAARTVLNQLKEGLSTPRSAQSVSLLAQNISRNSYMLLDEEPGKPPVLKLNADADRTWITLEKLLSRRLDESEQKLLKSDVKERMFKLVWVPDQDLSSMPTQILSSFVDYILSETGDLESSFGLSRKAVSVKLTGSNPVQMTVVTEDGQPADTKKALFVLGEIRRLLN